LHPGRPKDRLEFCAAPSGQLSRTELSCLGGQIQAGRDLCLTAGNRKIVNGILSILPKVKAGFATSLPEKSPVKAVHRFHEVCTNSMRRTRRSSQILNDF
jgi:hypothetical protein